MSLRYLNKQPMTKGTVKALFRRDLDSQILNFAFDFANHVDARLSLLNFARWQ